MTKFAPSRCPVPVVLLVFKRPDHTRQVLARLRLAQPPVLLVVADGPRPQAPGEDAACDQVRALIDEMVDWNPRLLTNYARTNLGLRQRVASGLTWAFEQVEQAIILEDDCVPEPTFFRFCSELLEHYKDDTRVGVVTGNNFQPPDFDCKASYYFSRFNHCWGWATWRRAWKLFADDMAGWPELKAGGWLEGLFPEPAQAQYWRQAFDQVSDHRLDSWAYCWTFSCWSQNLLTAIPKVNLVTNIGFGPGSTHTTDAASPLANLPTRPINFPLMHPRWVTREHAADAYSQKHLFAPTAPAAPAAPAESKVQILPIANAENGGGNGSATRATRLTQRIKNLWRPRRAVANRAVSTLSHPVQPHGPGVTPQAAEGQPSASRIPDLLALDQAPEALKLAQDLVTREPSALAHQYLLGLCLDGVGRHEEALEAYRLELARNPSHGQAREKVELLSKALTRPVSENIPTARRSWHTSLPREVLLPIQNSSHNYTYRGVPLLKNPFDFALYPLLIWKLKPRTILEIGSKSGGSALWLADLVQSFGLESHLYSLDLVKVETTRHPRVTFLEADGRALERALSPERLRRLPRPWLVIEDADHSYQTSSAVLNFFHPWLHSGEYIIIEDGIISDLSQDEACNSGPHSALKEFLARHPGDYAIDAEYCDFFGYNTTWCTNGFLKKVGGAIRDGVSESATDTEKVHPNLPTAARSVKSTRSSLLNLGCGARFHADWVNLDVAPMDDAVLRHDLLTPLPFADGQFTAVYHSHVLEHLPHSRALPFLRECQRVLACGGVLRVVVPDLETIARLYLKCLEGALAGEPQAAQRYDWMMLELLDQMVREQAGGEMLEYWRQDPMPAEAFVLERVGQEARQFLETVRDPAKRRGEESLISSPSLNGQSCEKDPHLLAPSARVSGEVHKWMYDRYSLARLLEAAGFSDPRVCAANQSQIPGFNGYLLDLNPDGSTRKPDSLFVEARK